jgi:hypothetical protein
MTNKETCEFCEGSAHPGIHLPSDFDDREESRDGKVFVAKCDACARYDSDQEAAEVVHKMTGWPVLRSFDRDDAVDPTERAQRQSTDFFRPYFDVPIASALKLGSN